MTNPRIPLLTVAQVAEAMNVSTMTVYRLIHSGELESCKIRKQFRVDPRDLNVYLQQSSTTGDVEYSGGAA